MTRFADMFFLIGILIFGYYTGSYNFSFTEQRLLTAQVLLPSPLLTAHALLQQAA